MLKITYSHTEGLHRWALCGQLAGPWVAVLRACWQRALETDPGCRYVAELSDVTFIDESGEKLLAEMRSACVELHAAGVDTKDLIENLTANGERPLRKRLGGAEGQRHWRCE